MVNCKLREGCCSSISTAAIAGIIIAVVLWHLRQQRVWAGLTIAALTQAVQRMPPMALKLQLKHHGGLKRKLQNMEAA
jgi:hypothetical protein